LQRIFTQGLEIKIRRKLCYGEAVCIL